MAERIFERKIYQRMLNWKRDSNGKTALLIKGARRVGKSTIAEEFAKKEYSSYILIDFSIAPKEVHSLFKDLSDLNYLFLRLQLIYHVNLENRKSVIIFDEVQREPFARQAIKHLVKDGRYDYIETGSLISIKENVKDILIPSEEQSIRMFPMDFEEFAWALGEGMIIEYIRDCFANRVPLHDSIHKKAMFLFKQYMLVGGMPKAIDKFISHNKQFFECENEKRNIIKTYRDDIHKIDRAYRSKVLSVFDQIPSFLSQHEKRVKIKSISNDTTAIDYEETFFWLRDSMICNECFLCTDPNLGLSLNEKRNFVKCYMGDTGLLLTHTFDENNEEQTNYHKELLSNKLSINKGMFFENIIAQTLVSNGHKLYFYTRYNEEKHRNDIEIDFLLTTGNKASQKLIPLEVKSSKSYKVESMKKFIVNSRNNSIYIASSWKF